MRSLPRRERPLIVSVGRLKAPKDFLTLVRALAKLRADSFEALIVGEGPDRARTRAGDRVARPGRSGCGWLGERRDVPELLATADVFVLSSSSEGMPVSVLEAMAAGLPVVASRVGGVPELVVDGETGRPRRVPATRRARRGARAASSPTRSSAAGSAQAGRLRAEEAFDLTRVPARPLELYSRELARRRLPAPTP